MRFSLILLLGGVLIAPLAQAQGQESTPPDTVKMTSAEAKSEHVARSTFTTAINEREPTDTVATLTTGVDSVFFFTEIVNMEGKTIVHRWLHGGEQKADVSFDIGGPRWRVYSKKKLLPDWVGTWTVEVRDGEGNTLHSASFEYKKPD
jgi:hypothetical protein